MDCDGRLVGINTAIATVPTTNGEGSGSIGIGFAVPAAVARQITEALRTDGEVAHPTLGMQTVPVVVRQQTGAVGPGLQVTEVTARGAADRAGIAVGDVITAIEGVDVLHPETVTFLEATNASSDRFAVTFVRDGREDATTLTLLAATTS
ncbi:hypothetical protein DEJ03_05255 [Curtobacterium sp. MCLR17_043]|uniref:S1C family serine protease n=1 Tax=Curtobacterium sp. MCLR17_043 TaxID=2175627 RepID=UPI000D9DB9AD|nr:S1C family serine protease [Curtobacterium sp. MCLR17_043]PYY47266.1 hypothetical protein DEJ03_05255 [Curtobacterium sp. MCLR17_043]